MTAFNLQIGINASGAKRGAGEVKGALEKIRGQARKTNPLLKDTDNRLKSLGSTARLIKGAIFGIFGGLAVRKIIQSADAFTKLENQIALVTKSSTEAAVVQQELFDLADRSRAPIAEIGTLYGRAALSAKELGANQAELLKFTEGVAQALAINGSNAAEARGSLIQLSQALGSGIVRAEEFNSVLEGARPVLVSVADGMGITVARLRQLVIAGKITSREFFDAFQSQLGNLQSTFDKTNSTIGQAGDIVNNAFIQAVGTLNNYSGAVNGVVIIMRGLANFIRGPMVESLIAFSMNIGEIINDFDNLFTTIGDSFNGFVTFVDGSISGSQDYVDIVGKNLASPWDSFRTLLGIATVEAASFFDQQVAGSKIFLAAILGDQKMADQAFQDGQDAKAARTTAINKLLADSENRRARPAAATRSARNTFTDKERADALGQLPSFGVGGTGGGSDADDKLQIEVDKFKAANSEAEKLKQELFSINDLVARAATAGIAIDPIIIQAAKDEATGLADTMKEGLKLTEDVRTAQEIYNNELQRFQELLDADAISQETFNRASEEARKTMEGASAQFQFIQDIGTAAAENIQGAFVDLFMSAGDGMDEFADQFGKTLQEMAANFLANQAIKFLLDSLSSVSGGGGFGAAIGGIAKSFAGENDAGGSIGSNQVGVAGEKGPELIRGPAAVISRQTSAGMLGSPELNVNVVNVSSPQAALDSVNTNAGDKQIVNSIMRNRAAIKRELGS